MRRSELDAVVTELREAVLFEANSCHAPAGSPAGGQFCSRGAGGVASAEAHTKARSQMKVGGVAPELYSDYRDHPGSLGRLYTRDFNKAFNAGEKRMAPDTFGFSAGKFGRRPVPRLKDDAPGRGHLISIHRGVRIRTLGSYTTPYYFADYKHPKLGSFNHSTSYNRIVKAIDRYVGSRMEPRPRTDLAPKRYRVRSLGRGI